MNERTRLTTDHKRLELQPASRSASQASNRPIDRRYRPPRLSSRVSDARLKRGGLGPETRTRARRQLVAPSRSHLTSRTFAYLFSAKAFPPPGVARTPLVAFPPPPVAAPRRRAASSSAVSSTLLGLSSTPRPRDNFLPSYFRFGIPSR